MSGMKTSQIAQVDFEIICVVLILLYFCNNLADFCLTHKVILIVFLLWCLLFAA